MPDLYMFDSVKHGRAGLGNVNKECGPTWRSSWRSIGGCWLATCEYDAPAAAQRELFLGHLGKEIRLGAPTKPEWAGFLIEAELTIDGLTYIRKWVDMANRVQVIYTRLGDNLLTNGSVETGIWAAYNAPTVLAQSSVWVSDGAQSAHIVANANNGAVVQSGMAVVAAKAYDVQVAVNIIAGSWKLEIYAVGTGAILGSGSENNLGQRTMRASIPNTSTYAGTIGIRLYSLAAAAEIYADGAAFRETALQARTAWYADLLSPTEYGTLELALLQSSMSDATANSHAATALAEGKWPRTIPPDMFGGGQVGQPDGLKLTFAGYSWSLRNKYVLDAIAGTTQIASTHVGSLVAAAEFVTAGAIAANTLQYQIDNRAPLRVWQVLAAIAQAGDAAGNRWTCGVDGNRLFYYQPASVTPDYRYAGGRLLSVSGAEILPWTARPGLVYLNDLPVGPGSISGNAVDDPHNLFCEEFTFDAADYLRGDDGNGGLSFSMKASGDQAAQG